jgi:hypothetical protein
MPSGFQQDSNQLQPNFYRVQIDTSSATYYPTADGDTNGGITPNGWDALATAPTTLVKGKARARGNMRFRNIVNALSGLTDCQILDITMTSETVGDDQATACTFTVRFDRDAYIPSTGTDIAGGSITTKALYIKNTVANAIRQTTSASCRVYDPTTAEGTQLSITASAASTATNTFGTVTVSLIDTVTVINA